jgi:hypothetical protein
MKRTDKKMYSAPTLIVHGDIERMTLGSTSGATLDASFPTHTPKADLTFS